MKNISSATLCITLASLIGTAHAQGTDFTGPTVGVSLSAARNKAEYEGLDLWNSESKKSGVVVRLDASYGFGLSPQWVLSVGATYDLNKADFGRVTNVESGTIDAKLKNHVAIYVAPGYEVAPNWLAYGKLSGHYARCEYIQPSANNVTFTHNGVGVGLGVATTFTRQIEGRFEIEQINYSRKDDGFGAKSKLKTTQATVYVGYRF